MKEIELKILNIDPRKMAKKLISIGARKVSEEMIIDRMYDFKDERIKNNKEVLRLRKNGKETEVTYKFSRKEDKDFLIHNELQTKIEDDKIMQSIFKRLGLNCIRYREKKRISFECGKTRFEIDCYPKIPPYLEIEGSKVDVSRMLRLLGYTFSNTTNMTSTQVIRYYKKNPKILRF